jgi:hypothetical protein
MTSVRYDVNVSIVEYAFAKLTATAKDPVRLDLTAGGSADAHALLPFWTITRVLGKISIFLSPM